ncbi:MAG: NUDIX domain-containing protein [Holosporaceae bacterium]|jgi:ADP-ribose pyrophosphatase YjhB (NUDIX family)|nr:NUDIX domain-containing protein [Holosporaceae bacterium]
MKSETRTGVYLLLKTDDEILLMLRQNTGYGDGSWGTVSGHVEEGEGIIDALLRETKEEIAVEICRDDLKLAHVMYYYDDYPSVCFFFVCKKYSGKICNAEPHKCGGVKFFKENELPSNLFKPLKTAFDNIRKGEFFSEMIF